MAGLIFIVLIIWVALGAAGGWISSQRGRSWLSGFLLGFFLNGIGLVIAALLPRPIEFQVRERLIVEQAVNQYRGPAPLQPGAATYGGYGSAPQSLTGVFGALEATGVAGELHGSPQARRRSRWNECFDAIEAITDDRRRPLEAAALELSPRFKNLRAWLFARDESRDPMVLLFLDESLLEVTCRQGEPPSVYYFYAAGGVQMVVEHDAGGLPWRIGLGRGASVDANQLHWAWEAAPVSAALDALEFAGTSAWIQLSTGPSSAGPGTELFADSPNLPPPSQGHPDQSAEVGVVATSAAAATTELTSVREKLELLQSLRNENLIDDGEHARRRASILDQATSTGPQ
jgi:hypothetical protein